MCTFKIVVLLLAVIAHGIESKSLSEVDENAQPRDVFDTAEALLADLRLTVSESQTSAISTLNLVINQVNAEANARITEARVALSEVTIALTEEIQAIRDDVELSGGDLELLDQCIVDYSDDLDRISTVIEYEIVNCLNNTVQQALDIIHRNIEHIQATTSVVERLELRLAQCRLLPAEDGEQCAISVITAVSIELVDLPARINEDVATTRAVVDALITTFDPCVADRLPSATTVGQEIIALIKECANLIQPN